uniref:NADH dehydrogenase subunit 1 n=1 Tax=Neucentropus mandjuricus TaxID=1223783 RepID=UPI00211409B2|nr:NADH dehydrogenase subunit 1 [Neucentropus mandjuricus]USL48457.1 NADH dehydrogenase subunit 1 [Neucentropus mandjuricus]
MNLVNYLLLIIGCLIGVAFLTLFERKILGYIQFRKGPNKVGVIGLFQPFSDAIKLFSKENLFLMNFNFYIYFICPILVLLNSMILWMIYYNNIVYKFNFLFMMVFFSLNVYMIMFMGWSSNSNYCMLGAYRGIIQTISYELSLVFSILIMFTFILNLNFNKFIEFQQNQVFGFNSVLMLIMLVCMLAELNRSPFDFVEGESELVSGFNVEYGGGLFAFIFLGEYLMIIFMSFLLQIMFFGFMGMLVILFFIFVIIWVRGSFPRYRYDKLMNLNWKFYLPVLMNFFIIYFSLNLWNM